jgi:hypothetical protein
MEFFTPINILFLFLIAGILVIGFLGMRSKES